MYVMGPKRTPMAIRLRRNSKTLANGCRVWTGNCLPRGYPLVGKGGHGNGNMYAHRAAYELVKGKIPRHKQIHHVCENVRCINPDHMIAVTHQQHRRLHLKTACPHGHEFTADNTYLRPDNGTRQCKQCRAIYMRKYYNMKG
jgi:hypothetical protein